MFFSGEGMVGERKCAQASHQVSQARNYRGIVRRPKRPTRVYQVSHSRTKRPKRVPKRPGGERLKAEG